ncbi:MAG: hypothetical protein GYA24_19185 [Candidatus Lokiarchaeota archaeon]|nr:hypothetical protein [Candidatus Lokiarchaeota archaeon]
MNPDGNNANPGKAAVPADPFDAEIRNRVGEKARLEFQREIASRERQDRDRRAKLESSKRERAFLAEKLEMANQVIEIAQQFWKKEVFMEIVAFFKRGDGTPRDRRFMMSRYRQRTTGFVRWWYEVYEGRVVIWCKENPLLESRKLLALGEDGGLFYVEVNANMPARLGRNARWIYTPADMAQALSRDQIAEIHGSISSQSIEALITWQMDDENNRRRGQLVRGEADPDEDDDREVFDDGYVVYDGDDDAF